MGLSELAEKLAKYRTRLAAGQAERIKPEHVDRVIRKLEDKHVSLLAELDGRVSPQDRAVLERRVAKVEELIEQARWLRTELSDG